MLLNQRGRCTTTSTCSHLYHHMLEHINGCTGTSYAVVGPCCNLIMGKVDKHMKFSINLSTQFFSFLFFLSSRWEKEREYESWVVCVRWTKRTICHEEKESTDTGIEFTFCIFRSSKLLVCWFHFHRLSPGVRPLFRVHPNMEGV